MKVRFTVFAVLALSTSLFAATDVKVTAPTQDTFVKNKHYAANQVPASEFKMDLTKSQAAVKEMMEDLDKDTKKFCKNGHEVFRLNAEKSSLKVTAFKNYKIPVVGKFKHFDGYLTWDAKAKKPAPEMSLLIDTGSFDSGVAERDSRVKHFLLRADEKKSAYATLKSDYEGDLNPAQKQAHAKLKIRGKKYDLVTKSYVSKVGESWTIRSAEINRLKVEIPGKDFLDLMELCNHESLTPVVDLEWDLTFDPGCK